MSETIESKSIVVERLRTGWTRWWSGRSGLRAGGGTGAFMGLRA